jgi:hypothetical protein
MRRLAGLIAHGGVGRATALVTIGTNTSKLLYLQKAVSRGSCGSGVRIGRTITYIMLQKPAALSIRGLVSDSVL